MENFPSEALYQNAKGLLALAYQLKYKKHKSEFVNVSTDSIIITLDCKIHWGIKYKDVKCDVAAKVALLLNLPFSSYLMLGARSG